MPEGLLGLERQKYIWTVFLPACLSVCPSLSLDSSQLLTKILPESKNQPKHLCLKGPSLLLCHIYLDKRFFHSAVRDSRCSMLC